MSKTIFVISDLHLGGLPGREMCSSRGQGLLAEFIDGLASRHREKKDVHLVIAGDFVDFLADNRIPFRSDQDDARDQLNEIIGNTQPIWTNLKALVAAGGTVTVLLGNHDLELSLPAVRDLMKEKVGLMDFIYDNEAFVDGDLLIEHGNRYDSWNMVDHGALRALRSALSRREDGPAFVPPPGSKLVVDVMNPLKKKYSFVDLLKPENEVLLPILMVLDPGVLTGIQSVMKYKVEMSQNKLGTQFQPKDQGKISATVPNDEEAFNLGAGMLGIDTAQIGAVDKIKEWAAEAKAVSDELVLKGLLKSLRRWGADADRRTFNVNIECADYKGPAEVAIKNGFKCVIYGHTHLVKRVAIGAGTYLNTGTWADLMRLPESILSGDDPRAIADLTTFLADVRSNQVAGWRRTLPTFARIDFLETGIKPDVYWFDGANQISRVEDGNCDRFVTTPDKAKAARGGSK